MTNKNTHARIKELRESKGLSQEELSEKAGVSLRTIQRMENDESVPRGSTLRNIASSLDVSSDYFSIIPSEINDSIETDLIKSKRKETRIPWYIIGFTIIGITSGFLIGSIMILSKLIPNSGIGGTIPFCVSILFGAIGIVIGNYIEKNN
jgi:transcriptional regulator with XRE-family HTH domain